MQAWVTLALRAYLRAWCLHVCIMQAWDRRHTSGGADACSPTSWTACSTLAAHKQTQGMIMSFRSSSQLAHNRGRQQRAGLQTARASTCMFTCMQVLKWLGTGHCQVVSQH